MVSSSGPAEEFLPPMLLIANRSTPGIKEGIAGTMTVLRMITMHYRPSLRTAFGWTSPGNLPKGGSR